MRKTVKINRDCDFYDKPEQERISLIGSILEDSQHALYFPVGLSDRQFNYGAKQGLIRVSLVNGGCFCVSADSPDDLDNDLGIAGDEAEMHRLRKKVITFIKQMDKNNVTYMEVLKVIQKHFNTGEIDF